MSVTLVLILVPLALLGGDSNCTLCHTDFFKKFSGMPFTHTPFAKGMCSSCHEAGLVVSVLMRPHPHKKLILKSKLPPGKHLIPLNQKAPILKVEIFDGETDELVVKKRLIFGERTPSVIRREKPPRLERFGFIWDRDAPIPRKKFIWVFNRPVESYLVAGGAKIPSISPYFSTYHSCYVEAEKAADIVAKDIFGKRWVFRGIKIKRIEWEMEEGDFVGCWIFRKGELPVIGLINEFPVKLRVFSEKDLAEKKSSSSHPEISPRHISGIDACYQCHPPSHVGTVHPIGLNIKDGMSVYCTSCHEPHAAKEVHLLRDKQEILCVSCHPGK